MASYTHYSHTRTLARRGQLARTLHTALHRLLWLAGTPRRRYATARAAGQYPYGMLPLALGLPFLLGPVLVLCVGLATAHASVGVGVGQPHTTPQAVHVQAAVQAAAVHTAHAHGQQVAQVGAVCWQVGNGKRVQWAVAAGGTGAGGNAAVLRTWRCALQLVPVGTVAQVHTRTYVASSVWQYGKLYVVRVVRVR